MPIFISIFLFFILSFNCSSAWSQINTNTNPGLTLPDMLSMEEITDISIDPGGRWGVALYRGAYQDEYSASFSRSFGTIVFFEVHPDHPPKFEPLLPNHLDRNSARIIGFSPSGERLAFYWLERTETPTLRIGIFDFAQRSLRWLPGTAHFDYGRASGVWVSSDIFAYNVAAPNDATLPLPDLEAEEVARRLSKGWHTQRKGDKPTGVVAYSLDTSQEQNSRCLQGKLVSYNIKSDHSTTLSEHAVHGLVALNDGQRVAGVSFCGGQSLAEKNIHQKISGIYLKPTLIDVNSPTATRYLCNNCIIKYDSLQISPSKKEIAFLTYANNGDPHNSELMRYDIPSGRLQVHSLRGILPWALNPADDHICQPPMVWIGSDVAIYAGRESSNIEAVHEGSNRGCDPTGRDWFLVTDSGNFRNLTAEFSLIEITPIAADDVKIYFRRNQNLVAIDKTGKQTTMPLPHLQAMDMAPKLIGAAQGMAILGGVSHPSSQIHITGIIAGEKLLIEYDLRSQKQKLIAKLNLDHIPVSISASGNAVIWRSSKGYATSYGLARDAGRTRRAMEGTLIQLNQKLASVPRQKPKIIDFTGPDGNNYKACLLVPSKNQERSTTIVDVYPFARSGCSDYNISWTNPALYASQGYAWLSIAPWRGLYSPSTGEFTNYADWVLPAIERATEMGYINPERLVLFGSSQGSFIALTLLQQTNLFRAAVISHGAANFATLWANSSFITSTLYGETWPPISDMARFGDPHNVVWLGGDPWQKPQSYIRISPLYSADKIDTPILFVNTDLDSFSMSHFGELHVALYRQNKPSNLVTYLGESHGLESPANIKDAFNRAVNWIQRFASSLPE